MRRWLPHPALSVLLAAAWLLLTHGFSGADLFWAALVGLAVPRVLHGFIGHPAAIRPLPALRLVRRVLWDILVANVTVARLVLGSMTRPRPAWVRVPLACDHPSVVALLAIIITSTPGTVSCVVDEARGEILVHALDCADPAALVDEIKSRYEGLLMAAFGIDPAAAVPDRDGAANGLPGNGQEGVGR